MLKANFAVRGSWSRKLTNTIEKNLEAMAIILATPIFERN
jgi:hypothetical protein